MADVKKLQVLDAVFAGHSLAEARRMAGYDGSTMRSYHRWLFATRDVRARADKRLRAGDRLPLVAMKALASYGCVIPKPEPGPADTPDIAATLQLVHTDMKALRAEVRELAERIQILFPDDVLIERARELSRHEGPGYFGSLTHLLANLRRRYNKVNLNDLRHAVSRVERDAHA
jgi:hypothetical protein